MRLAKERFRLLDVFGDVDFIGVDTTDKKFSVETGLVYLANRDAVPLSRSQEFLKDFLVPLHSRRLDEVQLAIVGLDLGNASRLEACDDNFIERFKALGEFIKFRLQAKTLVDEGGQGLGFLRSAVGFGGCHTQNITSSVCHNSIGMV